MVNDAVSGVLIGVGPNEKLAVLSERIAPRGVSLSATLCGVSPTMSVVTTIVSLYCVVFVGAAGYCGIATGVIVTVDEPPAASVAPDGEMLYQVPLVVPVD